MSKKRAVNSRKRIVAFSLLVNFLLVQCLPIQVLASEISGVIPDGNIYNIEGQKFSGETQFRQYDKFNLSQGDIANLIYKNGYKNFVNLVNSQVNIDGIINTMQGNNFYNGHAVFVSPLGVVIGASGVLNIGSFSALTPSSNTYNEFLNSYQAGNLLDYGIGADKYNTLIKDSHGNIVVNGRILARDEVNLYGDNVSILGKAGEKTGIVAGWKDNETVYKSVDPAKATFNALVSNNISDATNFALKDGKITIVSGFKDAENPSNSYNPIVGIKNSNLAAGKIDIQSNSFRDEYSTPLPEEAISSKVDITNSNLFGNDINISAVSIGNIDENSNLTEPTAILWLFGGDAKVSEYFSDGIYNGFDGVRTAAEINIINSIIEANNNIDLSTFSESSTSINTDKFTQTIPALFYGYGTKTKSVINIKNSDLKSGGDVLLDALSKNVLSVDISDSSDSPLTFTLRATDAYNMMMLKSSSQAETKVIIDNSKINATNLNAKALAYNEISNSLSSTVEIGDNDAATDTQGGSGATLVGVINATEIESAVEIKNNSEINTKEDTNLTAYNVNSIENSVSAETSTEDEDEDNDEEETDNKNADAWYTKYAKKAKEYYKDAQDITNIKVSDLAEKFQSKTDDVNNKVQEGADKKVLDTASAQVGVSFLWNNTNTTNNVIIDNSSVNAKNLNAVAHTVDDLTNAVTASSGGEAIVGAGVAGLVNMQNNNVLVNIKNAQINVDDLNAGSIIELPDHSGTFGISSESVAGLNLTLDFSVNANDDWDVKLNDITDPESGVSISEIDDLIPEIGLSGLFNNFVKGGAESDKAVSASIMYSQLNNNSEIRIEDNSIIKAINDVNLNAVTSTSVHDALNMFTTSGIIDFVKDIKDLSIVKYDLDAGSGLGAAILIQDFTNNAKATIDNSTINAGKDLNVNSAAEQSYLSIVTPGGKAKTVGVNGGITVQNLEGATLAEIKNNSKITAKNININAGNAKAAFSDNGAELNDGEENPNDKNKFEIGDSRGVRDHIMSILVTGSYTKQEGSSTDQSATSSSGQAYGASVLVQNINRVVKAVIDKSNLNATESANIISKSTVKDISLTLAGAFAGGVSIEKDKQSAANNGTATDDNKTQEMQNVGDWMDAIENAEDDFDVLDLGILFDDGSDDVINLSTLFDDDGSLSAANDPNKVANDASKNNSADINNANNQVDKNGNVSAGANAGDSNASNLANGGSNGSLTGANSPSAGTVSQNMSAAAAGVVSVITNKNIVTSEVNNSTINVGKDLNVTSTKEIFDINLSGGVAKSGNVGAGAALTFFTDNGTSKATINNSNITFTSNESKTLTIQANDKQKIINATAGVGVAKNDEQDKPQAVAIGGSFNANRFKGNTEATITNNSIIKTGVDVTGDINTTIKANANTSVYNTAGGVGFAGGKTEGTAVGAGIAGNLDIITKKVNAEISDSTLLNIQDLTLESKYIQDLNSIGVAGAIVTGAKSGYTFDGAVAVEVIANKIDALIKNSLISSSGDIDVNATSDLDEQSLAGALNFSTASSGMGVGLGIVVDVNNSSIKATADNSNIVKSGSIDIKADLNEDKKFLAANMGVQAGSNSTQGGGSNSLNVNGITEVLKSTVDAQITNNSILNSNGDINLVSNYENSNQGITLVGNNATGQLAVGGNAISSIYLNNINSLVDTSAILNSQANVGINANAKEYINLIPVAMTVTSGNASGVAANVAVNVIQNYVNAIVYGDISSNNNFNVIATDNTTIYERGGTLASANGSAGISGAVYFDYIDKNILAEVKNNEVNAGDITVKAIASNSFGGTKESITPDLTDSSILTPEDTDLDQNSNFANWNMAYSLGHGDKASVTGTIITKVIDNNVKSNVENSIINANSLKVEADDYTILNAIAGHFTSAGNASIGGNSLILVGNTTTNAIVANSILNIINDIDVISTSEKITNSILVGGGGSSKVAVNGAAHVNVIKDKTSAKIVDSQIDNAGTIDVIAQNKNSISSADLSVAGSGNASVGGILYVNKLTDSVDAFVGNDKTERTITSVEDIKLAADSDNRFRAYLANVAATSGNAAIGGLGIINDIDSNVSSLIDKANITSTNGKVDVIATRGFNRNESNKNNIFRNWFKNSSAYKDANQSKELINNDDLASLTPLVGGLNVAAGGKAAVSASIIVNDVDGVVDAKVSNSNISTEKGLVVKSKQDFVNFDTIAAVAGSSNAAVNAVGVINNLDSTLNAQVNDSKILKGGVDVDSVSVIELNQLVIAGQGAGTGAAVGAVVDVNNINDKAHAFINNSQIVGNTAVDAQHSIEINNILLAGTVTGTGAAIQAIPVINTYTGETIAAIRNNSQIKDGAISIGANDYIDNFSTIAGAAGVGTGGSVSSFNIINTYENIVSGYINNSIISTTSPIDILSSSLVDSENVLLAGGLAGVGASVLSNVIVNGIYSNVESYIANSDIKNAGVINLIVNRDKEDTIKNIAGTFSLAAEGAALSGNTVYNLYKNNVKAYAQNNNELNANTLNAEAYSKRSLINDNTGAGGAGVGVSGIANAIVNEVETNTHSYINAGSKNIDIENALNIVVNDQTKIDNTIGSVGVAGIGAVIAANVNVNNFYNNAIAEILSNDDGSVDASSAILSSSSTVAMDSDKVGVSLGFGAIAGDVTIVNVGKRNDNYSTSETISGIDSAVNNTYTIYNNVMNDGNYVAENPNHFIKTGSISRVKANLNSTGDIEIKAENKLKGLTNDKLLLQNTSLSGGGVTAGVGVTSVNFNNNTLAEIQNGKINAKNVDIKTNSSTNVAIKNNDFSIAGTSIQGAFGLLNNNSETTAKISGGDIIASNVSLHSKSNNTASVDNTSYILAGKSAGVALSEVNDDNISASIITGNININVDEKLSIRATGDSDISSTLNNSSVSSKDISLIGNVVNADSITKAVIENATGEINTTNLDIITDSNGILAKTKTDIVSVSGISDANVLESGTYVNAQFISGINNPTTSLNITSNELSNIISGANSNDINIGNIDARAANVEASSQISRTNVSGASIGGIAQAKVENKAKSNIKLINTDFKTKDLDINAMLNVSGNSDIDNLSISGISASNTNIISLVDGLVNVDIQGTNTVLEESNIIVEHIIKNSTDANITNASLALNVGQFDLKTDTKSNSNVNLSGNYNSDRTNINVATKRTSQIDLTTRSGGLLDINDVNIENDLTGDAVIRLVNLEANDEISTNEFIVSNISENIHDMITTSESGGFVSSSDIDTKSDFNTTTSLKIEDSSIDSRTNVDFLVENKNYVQDSASLKNGGVIAVSKNETNHTYTSNAIIDVINSKIDAYKININTNAIIENVKADNEEYITYIGAGGGFIAENIMKLTNTLNTNSSVNIKNSTIKADRDIEITTESSTNFKQKIQTTAGGFVAIPKNWNTLNANNENTLNIDSNSKLLADSELLINFDANNTLSVYSEAKASHLGFKDPQAESYLYLTINNAINNNGSLESGSYLGIDFMEQSYNNLTQYAYAEADALIPTTHEDGLLSKVINNHINIAEGANVTSGSDVVFNLSSGKGVNSSTISYLSICRAALGIPISNTGKSSKYDFTTNSSIDLQGDIVAGQRNNKYMKINSDGTIDSSTNGFYNNEYTIISDNGLAPEAQKNEDLVSLRFDLDDLEQDIIEINQRIQNTKNETEPLKQQIADLQSVLDVLLDENGNIVKQFKTTNEIQNIIADNLENTIVGSKSEQITSALYQDIFNSYSSELSKDEPLSIIDFLDANYSNKMTQEQKNFFITSYQNINIVDVNGIYSTYGDYVIVKSVNDVNGNEISASELGKQFVSGLKESLVSLEQKQEYMGNVIKRYEETLSDYQAEKIDILAEIDYVNNKDYAAIQQENTIIFDKIKVESGYIGINSETGSYNDLFTNNSDGNIIIKTPQLVVDNYSDYSLKFEGIDATNNELGDGLYIKNISINSLMNKDKAINTPQAYEYLTNNGLLSDLPVLGVHYKDTSLQNVVNIAINNYYDSTNPTANLDGISDILFIGDVKSDLAVNILNESGSIIFNENLNAKDINLIASQGSVVYTNTDNDFVLAQNSNIFAGEDVLISAKDIKIDGVIQSGNVDRKLIITNDMLNNLIVDPMTGEQNMIDISGSDNNIKALYKDGKIYLFDVVAKAGKVSLDAQSGKISGDGSILATNGFQNINIDNQSNAELVVGDITNNKRLAGIVDKNNNPLINLQIKNTISNLNSNTTNISNSGANGIYVKGIIKNIDGDIVITNSNSNILIGDNDVNKDNYISTENGNIIVNQNNGSIINGTSENVYKTLFNSGNDLNINIVDGDIGTLSNSNITDISPDKITHYNESINVKTKGSVNVNSKNQNKTDDRLVNLLSNSSDLRLGELDVAGNAILSAVNENSSIINANNNQSASNIIAKNVVMSANKNIGEQGNNLIYMQNTKDYDNSYFAASAGENIYLTTLSNSNELLNLNSITAKNGDANLKLLSNAIIDEISADNAVNIVQVDKSLQINNLGKSKFDDIILDTADIKVLDSYSEQGNSLLQINNALLSGKNNSNVANADIKLMADNINANITAVGSGNDIIITAKGVSQDVVSAIDKNTNRINYIKQIPINEEDAQNPNSMLGDYDYRAKNININVLPNDVDKNTVFGQLYVDKAIINSNTDVLSIADAYINDYAEFRNNKLTAIVDNDLKVLYDCDLQLHTAKKGSFGLILDKDFQIKTTTHVAHYNSDNIINAYDSENSFTRATQKENLALQEAARKSINNQTTKMNINEINPTLEVNNLDNKLINSNYEIAKISKKGCIIKNNNGLKRGEITEIVLKLADEDITINAKVVDVNGGFAKIEFINITDEVANKLLYNYLKKASIE